MQKWAYKIPTKRPTYHQLADTNRICFTKARFNRDDPPSHQAFGPQEWATTWETKRGRGGGRGLYSQRTRMGPSLSRYKDKKEFFRQVGSKSVRRRLQILSKKSISAIDFRWMAAGSFVYYTNWDVRPTIVNLKHHRTGRGASNQLRVGNAITTWEHPPLTYVSYDKWVCFIIARYAVGWIPRIDEKLSIGYYDRQGIIFTREINLISEFPCFLILLLALTRFEKKDWGIITGLLPSTVSKDDTGWSNGKQIEKKVLNLDLLSSNFERTHLVGLKRNITVHLCEPQANEPRCLAGRATSVYATTGKLLDDSDVNLVCKISNPKIQRPNEGVTLRRIKDITKSKNSTLLKHLPELYFHGDVVGTGTRRVRSMVGLK